jgi:broad specificity phosphatase PhoE
MIRLYLIRHGAIEPTHIYYGHHDVVLSASGREQIQRAADALATIRLTAIYCSDLRRAQESAAIIAAPHGLTPIADAAFREINLGILEGMTFVEAQKRYPDLACKRYEDMVDWCFPGGETLHDAASRVNAQLDRIVAEQRGAAAPLQAEGASTAIALVAHNSVNRILLGRALGLPLEKIFDFQQDFACINGIDYDGVTVNVAFLNWRPCPFDA